MFAIALILSQQIAQASTPPPIIRIPSPAPSSTAQIEPRLPPANDGTIQVDRVGNWAVRVDMTLNAGCYIYSQFADGSTVRVQTDPSNKIVYFGIGNWRWRSLTPGQTKPLEVQMDNFEPWEGEANIVSLGANMLWLSVDGAFLNEMAQSWTLYARSDNRQIAKLSLRDSEKALSALLECEKTVSETIADPFAQ